MSQQLVPSAVRTRQQKLISIATEPAALPTKRASGDTCPYVFNKEGKPSLGDLGGGERKSSG